MPTAPTRLPRFPAMLDLLSTHDVVIGSRYVPGGATRNWPASRRALSWAANSYARGVLRLRTRDVTAGFRAWRADALARAGVLETTSEGYGFQVENTWRAERAPLRIAEHPDHLHRPDRRHLEDERLRRT